MSSSDDTVKNNNKFKETKTLNDNHIDQMKNIDTGSGITSRYVKKNVNLIILKLSLSGLKYSHPHHSIL